MDNGIIIGNLGNNPEKRQRPLAVPDFLMTSVLFHPLGRPGTSNIRFFSTSCAMVLFLYFDDLRGRKLNYEISQIVFLDTLSGEVCFTAKRRQHEHMDISKKLVNRLTTEKTRSKLPHYRYLSYSY